MKRAIGMGMALLVLLFGVILAQRIFRQASSLPNTRGTDAPSSAFDPQESSPGLATLRSPLPTPTLTPLPIPTPTQPSPRPTEFPGPLPPGPKIVFAEKTDEIVILWAASAVSPERRKQLAVIETLNNIRANLSNDGTRIAYTITPPGLTYNRSGAELWVLNLRNGEKERIATAVDMGRYWNYPIWSPDDRYLIVNRIQRDASPPVESPIVDRESIVLIDLQTYAETELAVSTQEIWMWPLDWSPDSRHFYYMTGNEKKFELWGVDIKNDYQKEFVRLIWEGAIPRCFYISSSGENFACSILEKRNPVQYAAIRVPTAQEDSIAVIVSGGADEVYNPIWLPGKEEITVNLSAQGTEPAQLQAIDIHSGQARTIASMEESPDGKERRFIPIKWSSQGDWLLSKEFPGDSNSLLLISQDGSVKNQMSSGYPITFIGWLVNDLPSERL